MQTLNFTSIKKELTVQASQEIAFKVFTEQMNLWWPKSHHIGKCPMTELVLEPRVNGQWYSLHEDGSKATVGYVLKYEPFDLFVLAWQINGEFKFDPHLVTEVVVQFIAEGPKTTIVKFEHKDIQSLGGGEAVQSMDNGWGMILNLFKNQAEYEG